MTPDEAADRFDRLLELIERDLPEYVHRRLAENAIAQISDRVIKTGRDWRGNAFKPYSTKPILTSGTTAKSKRIARSVNLSSKEARKKLQWRTIKHKGKNIHLFILEGGYKEVRRLEGLQTGHKDFIFTWRMWPGFGVKRFRKSKDSITVTLGGKNEDAQNKIDRNSEREGVNIINISDNELDSLAKMVDKEIQRYINKVGLS